MILVDGRRVGYSGVLGGVTDISTIPLSMVERIEILLDGASAVYGSDAVGGVVNVITRKDYSRASRSMWTTAVPDKERIQTRARVSVSQVDSPGTADVPRWVSSATGTPGWIRPCASRSYSTTGSTLQTTMQKNTAAGPQIRVWSWFYDESCTAALTAILWGLDGTADHRRRVPDPGR